MNKLRKFLAASTLVTTVFGLTVVVNPASAAANDGDLIKMNGVSSVYYLKGGKRFVFPNESTYFSWYSDWNGVKVIPQDELYSYPLGGNVTLRAGTKLVKITTNPTVYAVEPNGTLRSIVSEANAIELWGANWAKNVVDVADAFFTNYTVGQPLTAGTYPAGTVLRMSGSSDLYYFDGSNYRKFANDSAFLANGFNFAYVVTTNKTISATGTAITGAEAALMNVAQGSSTGQGGIATGTGTLTVALSNNTPAAQNVPQNTPTDMLKFNVTASNDADIVVNGIKFTAAGLGTATEIDEVTVYADGVRYGNAKDVSSNNDAQIVFSTPLTVAKGTTKTISVRAKVAGTAQYALKINAAADVMVLTGVTVAGTFPVMGNTMSGVNVTVGALTMANDGSLADVQLGTTGATLAKFKATNNNVEDITVKSITLKKDSSSSAADDDFSNLKLYMDGTEVASATAITNKYLTFTLNTPVVIAKNVVKRFTVKGDVIDGAGKTMKVILDSTADVTTVGSQYGYQNSIVNSLTGASFNITAGAVTIEKINAATDKIKKDTTDAVLGTYKLTVNTGKTAELSTLKLTITSANDAPNDAAFASIENIEVYDKTTGIVYDMSFVTGADADDTTKVYQNTSMSMILASGVTHELQVRADVKSTATAGHDYTVAINSASTDIVLKESGNDTAITDITPNSSSLNKVTVTAAGLTFTNNALSATYNAVIGASDIEIMNFNVKAGQVADVRINELKFKDEDAGTTVTKNIVSDFKLWKKVNGTYTLVKTVSASNLASEEITFNGLDNLTIAMNATENFKLTTSLVKSSGNGGESLKYGLSGYSVEETDKGTTIYDTSIDGDSDGVVAAGAFASARTVEIKGNGTLYVAMDKTVSGLDKNAYKLAGSSMQDVASIKMKAENGGTTITKFLVYADNDTNAGATTYANLNKVINKAYIYDGATKVMETTDISGSTITFDNLTWNLASDITKNYTLKVDFNKIGLNEVGDLGEDIPFYVDNIEAKGTDTGDTFTTGNANGAVAAAEIVYDLDANGTYDEAADIATAQSYKIGAVATRISSVAMENSYSGVTVGTAIASGTAANAAIIKVTTDASGNSLVNGDAIKTILQKIKVQVENNVTSYTATIERIGGVNSPISGTVSGAFTQFTVTGTDYELAPSTSAYYLIKVTPHFTSTYAGEKSIKVNLDKLDGTGGTNDASGGTFVWKDSSDTGAFNPNEVRLGVSSANGTLIKN